MDQALERNGAGIPVRELGRAGSQVSIVGLGGGDFCRKHSDEAASVRLVQTAIDEGVTFMDNAWDYHDGESERRMGIALECKVECRCPGDPVVGDPPVSGTR